MNRQDLRIAPIAGMTTWQILTTDLGLPVGADHPTVLAELLRAITWASTRDGDPVAEHTLLDRCVELLLTHSSESAQTVRAQTAQVLADLETLGDLTCVSAGHWICTLVYLLSLGDHGTHLFIGGQPLHTLSGPLQGAVHPAGPIRRLVGEPPTDLPVLTITDWCGLVPDALDTWTDTIMRSTPLAPSQVAEIRQRRYRFYVPAAFSADARHDHRWHPPSPTLSGRFLARVEGLTGHVDHEIVRLVDGRIAATHPCDRDTAIRLMFGIDQRARRPVRSRLTTVDDRQELTITEAMPRAETRLLFAASGGTLRSPWQVPKDSTVPSRISRSLRLIG